MLRPEMSLPERSEFSSQALLLIRFQILYFSQIPEWNKDPTSRISVPFYPGNSEYFPVFLNSSSFRQIRIYITQNGRRQHHFLFPAPDRLLLPGAGCV